MVQDRRVQQQGHYLHHLEVFNWTYIKSKIYVFFLMQANSQVVTAHLEITSPLLPMRQIWFFTMLITIYLWVGSILESNTIWTNPIFMLMWLKVSVINVKRFCEVVHINVFHRRMILSNADKTYRSDISLQVW